MNGKKIIITGATGMVGGCALRLCLDDPDVSMVTVIGRRSTGIRHDKLQEIIHKDFTDFTPVKEILANHDVALYCLGAYTGSVPDDLFRQITVDYTLAFAEALLDKSPQAAFCFLSGMGADLSGKSRMAFARYKGIAEKALMNMGFSRLHIFRPGYIYPVTPREEPNLLYRLYRPLYPVLKYIFPNMGISSEDLAGAMVYAGLSGTGEMESPILENRDIRIMAGLMERFKKKRFFER